jgi:alginate O-acetyltransferase complex protein AlgI
MLFNSLSFAIFFPIVFFIYWFITNRYFKLQNFFLLAFSYFFYACWDWRFLFLLIFSTTLDYFTGLRMYYSVSKTEKKIWLCISVIINLGFLGFFKYYNFFITSFVGLISHLGVYANPWTLKIILPVGISFYTFHGLSYVIDIYKGKIKAEKKIVDYSLFVSFFPLLVAGPIERATHLLPQIQQKRIFEYSKAVDGLKQILWGLFKKIVIADQCSEYATLIFKNYTAYSGSTLLLGSIFFAIQIYCDFSGYSDIALGIARLLGIDLLRNFAFPYFSRNIAEFWRRWHISLSTWFRDYLYIPLGGSKRSTWITIRNIFIIFLVSGFWHGANWTFIVWGALNAIYILPSLIRRTNRNYLTTVAQDKIFPSIKEAIQITTTFFLTVLAWIFFRSETLSQAVNIQREIFSKSLLQVPYFPGIGLTAPLFVILVAFILIEWCGKNSQYAIQNMGGKWPVAPRWLFYFSLILVTYYFSSAGSNEQFIYFQF